MITWQLSGILVMCIYMYSISPTFEISFKEMRRCLSSESKTELFWNASLHTCGKKCGATQNCLSFNYFVRGKICMILAKDTWTVGEEEPKGPCLHVLRSDIRSEHVCDEQNGGCGVTACPLSVVDNADILGNMLTVGSRITVKCHSGYTKLSDSLPIQCGEDGTWINLPQCSATATTSFTFGFLVKIGKNYRSVFVVSSSPANVVLTVPLLDFRHEIIVTSAAEIDIPYLLYIPDDTGTFPYGFRLESSAPIGVYVENGLTGSSDGTAVIPDGQLSTEYVLLSWHQVNSYYAEFIVVATMNNTSVSVVFPDDSTLTLTLNSYQMYYYQTLGEISGTFISSSDNVAVFAGHECTNVITGLCDHLYEQMPPISDLQREFVISYPYPRFKYVLRIIAVVDGTEITLSTGVSIRLNRGKYSQEQFNNEAIAITSTNKVMVAAYSLGRESRPDGYPGTFDGAMLIVPGLSQYKERYTMFVPSSVEKCVLMVTYPSYISNINNIRFNQEQFIVAKSVDVRVTGRGTYSVVYAEIQTGTSVIYTIDGTPFGAYLSFFRDKSESWLSLPYKF